MSPDCSWTEYGRGLAVDAVRLWTDCGCGQFADMDNSWLRLRSWTGHDHGLTAGGTRTRTGCGHGLDQDKDADSTRPRSRRGCGRLSDWTTIRTSASDFARLLPAKARTLRGRKNLILMRSKACPRYKLKNLALRCDRRERHALAAICNGTMFPACLGGKMENHALASASVASAR